MILEKTGMVADYYDEITTELFDGYLGGEAKAFHIRLAIDENLKCISNALSQIKTFFKEIDFEFSDEDGEAVAQVVKNKKYMTRKKNVPCKKFVDIFTALSSNKKVSYITVTVINGEILKISVLSNDLEKSITWKTSDLHRKDLIFNDLFIRRKTKAEN